MLAGTLIGVLIGVLILAGILTKTLWLVVTLAGIFMLAKILARILTLARTGTGISMPASTVKSEEFKLSDGAPLLDGTLARHRLEQGNNTWEGSGGYRGNRRKQSRIRDARTMKW